MTNALVSRPAIAYFSPRTFSYSSKTVSPSALSMTSMAFSLGFAWPFSTRLR
jgi:hypothetical protein